MCSSDSEDFGSLRIHTGFSLDFPMENMRSSLSSQSKVTQGQKMCYYHLMPIVKTVLSLSLSDLPLTDSESSMLPLITSSTTSSLPLITPSNRHMEDTFTRKSILPIQHVPYSLFLDDLDSNKHLIPFTVIGTDTTLFR